MFGSGGGGPHSPGANPGGNLPGHVGSPANHRLLQQQQAIIQDVERQQAALGQASFGMGADQHAQSQAMQQVHDRLEAQTRGRFVTQKDFAGAFAPDVSGMSQTPGMMSQTPGGGVHGQATPFEMSLNQAQRGIAHRQRAQPVVARHTDTQGGMMGSQGLPDGMGLMGPSGMMGPGMMPGGVPGMPGAAGAMGPGMMPGGQVGAGDWQRRYMQGGMMLDEQGFIIVPSAESVISARNFTLEGMTLEQQIEEIGQIRAKQKREEQKVAEVNRKFKERAAELGVRTAITRKHGQFRNPLDRATSGRMQMTQGNPDANKIFDAVEKETQPKVEMEYPEWMLAILEFSGISATIDYIREDRIRRSETDFVHPFPDVHRLVTSLKFECFGGFLIILNAGILGAQLSQVIRDEGQETYQLLEQTFTLIFVGEWLLRVVGLGFTMIFDAFNMFDTLLVIGFGFIPQYILPMLIGPENVPSSMLRTFTALRCFRLVRLAKAVRFMPQFREMWALVNGFASSLRVVMWTLVILSVVVFCFSVIGVKYVGHSAEFNAQPWQGPEFLALVDEHFGSVGKAALTFFQILTLDRWGESVVRPLTSLEHDSSQKIFFLRLFFVTFIVVAVMILLNLVMAIIVEKTFSLTKQDEDQEAKDMQKKKEEELMTLTDIFLDMDEDRSGDLNKHEFMWNLDHNVYIRDRLVEMDMTPEFLKETWEILDDGDNSLTVYEFTSGIRSLKGNTKTKDVLDTQKRLEYSRNFLDEVMERKVDTLDRVLFVIHRDLQEMRQDCELIASATAGLATMVREFYDKAHAKRERRQKREAKRGKG